MGKTTRTKVLIIGEEEVFSQIANLVLEVAKGSGLQKVVIHQTTTEEVASKVFKNIYQKVIQVRCDSNLQQIPSNLFEKGGQKCWVL